MLGHERTYVLLMRKICINILRFNAAIVKKALLHLLQCYTVMKMCPSGFPLSFYAVSNTWPKDSCRGWG